MTRLATEMRDDGAIVTTWQELKQPGFLFEPIGSAIDAAGVVLAETTTGNPNVLFELGYAIAKRKHVYQLENENAARPRRFPPLEPIRSIRYTKRSDIINHFHGLVLREPPLAERLGLQSSPSKNGALYFLPSRRGADVNETLWRLCNESPFESRSVDAREVDYDNLSSQARAIADAELFVTLLVSEKTKEYWDNNAQLMLFAGLAHGMGDELAVMTQQPLKRLLDLGESALTFVSESEASFRLEQRLKAIATKRLTSPVPSRSVVPARTSRFSTLFIGHLDARSDFELGEYFLETPEFHHAESGQKHLFVGSKGAGKTANFETLKARLQRRNIVVVSIAPQDFEFPRLAAVFEEHLPFVAWQFVYGSFWRFIFLTEILRAIQLKFLDHLLRDSTRQRYARELLKWLDGNERLLAIDFVSRVNTVLAELSQVATQEEQLRRVAFEDLLQAARMYDIERHLKQFASQFNIRLLVDDLDRNWSPATESANKLIISMLNEILALMANQAPNLKPTVFIRKDVFSWLKDNDPELLKRDPGMLGWTRDGLEILIGARIASHFQTTEKDPANLWNLVFPPYTRGERTRDFILSRTLRRPRDVIQFCQKAVEFAQQAGRTTVHEDDVYAAWDPSGALLAAQMETEYSARYPNLGVGILLFLEQPLAQAWSSLIPLVERLAREQAGSAAWLARTREGPIHFLRVLYETGFVGVETKGGSRWFDADRDFDEISRALPDDFTVVVHPAFHRYLRSLGS